MEAKGQTTASATVPAKQQNMSADKAADAVLIKIQSPEPVVQATEEKPAAEQVVDLDSLGTFVFQGKKYTPEDLRSEIMMRKDYTKKTQELASYKKYDENLKYDLQTVRQNPNLVETFKKTYPEKYHNLLDVVLKHDQGQIEAGQENAATDLSDLPKPLRDALHKVEEHGNKLEELNRFLFEQKVQANQALVDHVFETKSQKYPFANPDSVVLKAESLVKMNKGDDNFEMTDVIWDRLFKINHQENEKRYADLYKKRVDDQLKKGEKAKDSGPGGLAPGRERKKIALEDVADQIIQDLQGR